MMFNGSALSKPAVIDSGSKLTAVSCPSASFCAATDSSGHVVTFNGTSWSTPVGVDPGGQLTAVSCPSAGFCAATDGSGHVVSFDGTSWSTPVAIHSRLAHRGFMPGRRSLRRTRPQARGLHARWSLTRLSR